MERHAGVAALRAIRALLHYVHDQLATRGLYDLHPVGLGVVRLARGEGSPLVAHGCC